jgi:hypothetical protein
LFGLGGGQLVDESRICHRVEMQIGHYENLSGNGRRRGRRLAVCRSAQIESKGRQHPVPEASQ